MSLDKYKKGNISLREKYSSLNDEQFVNLAAENMAKLFVKITDYIDAGKNNKYIDKKIEKLGQKYIQWGDQVNIVEFKKTLRKKFAEVSLEPHINETLLTSRHIINIKGGIANNIDEGLAGYSVSIYDSEDEFDIGNSIDELDVYIPIKATNEQIERGLENIFSINC